MRGCLRHLTLELSCERARLEPGRRRGAVRAFVSFNDSLGGGGLVLVVRPHHVGQALLERGTPGLLRRPKLELYVPHSLPGVPAVPALRRRAELLVRLAQRPPEIHLL